jgi:LysM repeat protein
MSQEKTSTKIHKVRKGESLWRIARKYGCEVDEIVAANPKKIVDQKKIFPGQKLSIPACSGRKSSKKAGRTYNCNWKTKDVNSKKLKALMKAEGFDPPKKFRALVVKTTLSKNRKRVVKQQAFDYGGASDKYKGWNPASTVKLYSAVSALERVRALGFGPGTKVTFHYDGGDKSFKLEDLYEDAAHWSKNIPHNRLTQLAGFDLLNGAQGTLRRAGLEKTCVMRAYAGKDWEAEGHSRSLRAAPAITLRSGKKTVKIPASKGREKCPCSSAACTSVGDLARFMCRLMLHEQLPVSERLRFGSGKSQNKHLQFIRRKLNRKRKGRKDTVWKILEKHFIPKKYRQEGKEKGGPQLFRKSGYSYEWRSDNFYVYIPPGRVRWIVAMAGYPGKECLNEAADVIARIIKDGRL